MKKSFRQFIAGLSAQRSFRLRAAGLLALAVSFSGCWTSILTVAPTTEPVAPVKTVYTTTVTTPSPKQTTYSTVTVTNYNEDMSFYLDLRAVAAAYAESRSVREFEHILNSSKYMINNLDLNRDGWVDYLRVIETRSGYYHALLIQACLAPSVFQDIATLVAERRSNALYVEVIGDRYLYGYNYIVRPVFVNRPPLWSVYGSASYQPWVSPYHYGAFPSYYTKPKPIYLNHYQAYVNTYITNHHYCHQCDYPSKPFYSGYTQMTQPHGRNDYQTLHPDQSFERRVTQPMSRTNASKTVNNAGQLREATEVKPTTESRSSATTSTTRTSSTTSSSRTTTKPATTERTSSATQTRQPSTQVDTRVNKSGATKTTIRTTDSNGRTSTVKRETSTRTSTSTQQRQGSSTRSSQGTRGESSPRSSQRER